MQICLCSASNNGYRFIEIYNDEILETRLLLTRKNSEMSRAGDHQLVTELQRCTKQDLNYTPLCTEENIELTL